MIPRTLSVTRDKRVLIKRLEIGKVTKVMNGWFFQPNHPCAPESFRTPTVKEIKEAIAAHIPRDAYVKLVEDQPE